MTASYARPACMPTTIPTPMFKFILLLSLGIAIGYGYGWNDAQRNGRHIGQRLVDRAGGESRSLVSADVDTKFRDAEKR
jgi:hypothetical protein